MQAMQRASRTCPLEPGTLPHRLSYFCCSSGLWPYLLRVSRAPTRLEPARAALVGKIAAWLLLSPGCLETGYVLRSDAESDPQAGQPPGGAAAGIAGESAGGGGAGTAGSPADCEETFQSGVHFRVCSARYWGGSGDDTLRAVELGPGGEIWIAGDSDTSWDAPTLEVRPGAGVVARARADGAIISVARVGGSVFDLALVAEGVVAATDEGLVALSPELSRVVAENPLGQVSRVAGSGERIVALTSDGRVVTMNESLGEASELGSADKQPEDVAIDATGRVAVTGFRQPAVGAMCLGRLPFIETYAATGELLWNAYGFADAPGWCASSTGRRVVFRGDWLFYAGEQEGGNSVHQREPRDLSLPAPLVSYDDYSTSAGKAIDEYSFVARFSVADGTLETGQVIVPRDAERTGGTLFTSALAVDDGGRIFLGGRVSCCIEAREQRQVSGEPLGAFSGDEASLLILSPDLRERVSWTSFTGSGLGSANIESIAVRGGVAALVGSVSAGSTLLVHPADAPGPNSGSEGYLVSFPAP